MITTLIFSIGIIALVVGAEMLVRGAAHLAAALGLPPLIVGLTVVAYGTGAPELLVGMVAAYQGETAIALGNVVGSGIANTLFILGASAAVCPLIVQQQLIRMDIPIMIGVTFLLYVIAWHGIITPVMGGLFFLLMIGYTWLAITQNEQDNEFEEEFGHPAKLTMKRLAFDLSLIICGIVILSLGADWLITAAKDIARHLGVSELIIGLTVVAFGTSLPELATSVIAALHGKREIAVGNVVGSNIFNILGVLGLSALVSQDGIAIPQNALDFDIPVLLASAVACLPIFFTGHEISRWEGFLFVFYYIAYITYLVLLAIDHVAITPFTMAMLFFVIPLTLITLAINLCRHLRG